MPRIAITKYLPAIVLGILLTSGCIPGNDSDSHVRAASVYPLQLLAAPILPDAPFVAVLGVGQDGGVPQAGNVADSRWGDPGQTRRVSSLAVVDPRSSSYWIIDATPDFPSQLRDASLSVVGDTLQLQGVFLTHAHIGHYTGLMYLGHEAMGAQSVSVYAMPRMAGFLKSNGPWDQLVRFKNIQLQNLSNGSPVRLADSLSIVPLIVPHRQEYSEVVGYRIQGERRSVLYIPDIDSWAELDEAGTSIESMIKAVDFAFLDGTFFENGEIPGRDMSGFPHPFIRNSMERFGDLPAAERSKLYFIHLNHSNPALDASSTQSAELLRSGMHVAERGMLVPLN